MNVKVPEFWIPGQVVDATTVQLAEDGRVEWNGRTIGYVTRGCRTYSPPTHKGSRIARYHKQVPEWYASTRRHAAKPEFRKDTRREALQALIGRERRVAS
jgi:hypothetical protein